MTEEELEQRSAAIFEKLLELQESERLASAITACGGDQSLLGRVRSLLDAMPLAEGFLSNITVGPDETTGPSGTPGTGASGPNALASAKIGERPGDRIGPYKLLEKIGEGGFGVVFMAEQERPVRRRVALKVIKLGMDTREVVARFEAERQALAMMDHPNIARVFDAGSTETGRPYFVMELVRGSPITEYADKNHLTATQRVALLADVCRAVQHAHSKGVIHRDLKPSNVLVTVADDKPIPKVIDFGIAKATQSRLTDQTLFTAFRQMIGTPQYMSPEQADSDGTDVDTRTDVYSLGVVLYELLVGTTPLDAKTLRSAAFEAMRKMIREAEPAKPSNKLSLLGETAATVAANRGTDPKRLGQSVRGELDWIVMRALEKDRGRRYETAAALADDLNRYIKGEAVLAGPPSGLYQMRKLARRHRTAIAVTFAVFLVVAAGVIGATAGFVRLRTTKLEARAFAYRAAINEAGLALRSGDGPRFSKQLAAAPVEHRGWEWDWLDRAGTLRRRKRLDSDPGEQFVAITTATNTRAAGVTSTGKAVMWDLGSGHVLWRRPVTGIAINGLANLAALSTKHGSLEVCNLDTGAVRWNVPAPATASADFRLQAPSDHAFSLDGSLLSVGYIDKPGFVVFDVATGHPTSFITDGGCYPQFLVDAFTGKPRDPRGRLFTGHQGSGNRTIELVNPLSDAKVTILPSPLEVSGWAFETARVSISRSELSAAQFLPRHGVCAIYSTADGGLIEYPLPTAVVGQTALHHQGIVSRFALADLRVQSWRVTPDESKFITVLLDGSVWTTPVDPAPAATAMGEPYEMVLSPDASRMITLGWGLVSCHEVVCALPLWSRNVGESFCHFAAWSPDGARVVVTANDESDATPSDAYVLDGRTGTPLEAWTSSPLIANPGHPRGSAPWAGLVSGLAFTPDGSKLRVAHPDGSLSRVDPTTWKFTQTLPVHLDAPVPNLYNHLSYVDQLLPEPKGGPRVAQLTSAQPPNSPMATALIVRDGNDQEAYVARVNGAMPLSVAWSPDGKSIVAGYLSTSDSFVREMDSTTGKERWRTSTADKSAVWRIFVTPDQSGPSRVVAMTGSQLMEIFDFSTGDLLLSVKRGRPTEQVVMTPDGALLNSDCQGGWGTSILREDLVDPETQLAAVNRFWPAGVSLPSTVADARRQVFAADNIVTNPLSAVASTDPSLAPLVAALTKTVEPSANWLNSWAIGPSIDPKSTQEQKDHAIAGLQRTVALVPRSLKLQYNLGSSLLENNRFAESLVALTAAADLYADLGKGRSAKLDLLRSVAARGANDPQANAMYAAATALYDHADPAQQAKLHDLREEVRKTFGR